MGVLFGTFKEIGWKCTAQRRLSRKKVRGGNCGQAEIGRNNKGRRLYLRVAALNATAALAAANNRTVTTMIGHGTPRGSTPV